MKNSKPRLLDSHAKNDQDPSKKKVGDQQKLRKHEGSVSPARHQKIWTARSKEKPRNESKEKNLLVTHFSPAGHKYLFEQKK